MLLKTTIFFIFVQSTYTITMEKLRSLRKRRGYTQEYMSNILSTDVSNYCRKENGEVRIFDDEWEKLAKALDVPVEDIKEERTGNVVQNLTFNDSSSNTSTNSQTGNYNQYQYYNIPEYMLENHKEYIDLLKEQVEALKQELEKFKSKK
ncbi:regulatory protein [Chryseobacterium piperi]|uniref:Regulatory protein n=2 Tax=Chryseobacterium piperi TaxID=558152 RepID=A0A086AG96_9FLAO|nr:regulatory protein [Chryseobacterium piperi]